METPTFVHAFFEPRIGAWYGKPESIFKKKILVLGDSHYCNLDCSSRETCGNRSAHQSCTDFTSSVIDDTYLNPGIVADWKKTYSTFINSLLSKSTTLEERECFFKSVVFYNYLQIAAGKNADEASRYEYAYGDNKHLVAFYEVLDFAEPDVVISWGNRLWEILPNDWGYGEASKGDRLLIDGMPFDRYYTYPYLGRSIQLIGVHHPSAGYASELHSHIFDRLNIG